MHEGRPTAASDAAAGPSQAEPVATQRRVVATGAFLAVLMALQAIVFNTFGAISPFIRADLGLSTSVMGVIGAMPYASTILLATWLGGRVDRYRPESVLLLSCAGMALALGVIASAPVFALVALGFFGLGATRSSIPPLTDRLGYELTPPRSRGAIFGFKSMGTPVGAAIAATALPTIAATAAGWRGALAASAATTLVLGAALHRVTVALTSRAPTQEVATGGRQVQADAEGAGTSDSAEDAGASDATRPAQEDAAPHRSPRPAAGPAPLMDLLRRLWWVVAANVGLGVFMSAGMTFLVLFLVDEAGLDPVQAGRWFAMFAISAAVGRLAWGWLSDVVWHGRRGYPIVLTTGCGGAIAIVLGNAPVAVTEALGPVSVILFGFFAQAYVGLTRAIGAEVAGPGNAGRAGGMLLTAMMTGGIGGPILFGTSVDITGTYALAWSIVGGLAVVVALALLPIAVREPRRAG